jgi:hypothetical protein
MLIILIDIVSIITSNAVDYLRIKIYEFKCEFMENNHF